ncbi:LysR substrate-binding domain-containing protein [Isoalcanivorax indicus]|uniref:LysR substrate-binding domain-containing protein n=1 Tax=Isoalcanivorax indicus TaxID=2202653 RepID=UPI000DB9B76E|nr:LysR substrate-binding domain-containing protein [Isoalcanivorax indicus]
MPRRLPSLVALRAFEAAGRHLSAKRAAAELSVTATAISHQIRQLEETLGVPLFVRRPRQLLLTPEGRALQGVLGGAFDDIAAAVARLRAPPSRHTVILSATPAVAMRWLLPWVCILREQAPTLDLHVHATHEAVALDGVAADLAIRHGDGQWPGLAAEKLFDDELMPVCSPSLNLKTPEDLKRVPLIHFAPQNVRVPPPGWSDWQRQALAEGAPISALDTRAGLVFSDETHAISAALGGQGVALAGQALITDELSTGRLVQPFGPALLAGAFYLVYPKARSDDPSIRAVCDWVRWLRARYEQGELLQCMPA